MCIVRHVEHMGQKERWTKQSKNGILWWWNKMEHTFCIMGTITGSGETEEECRKDAQERVAESEREAGYFSDLKLKIIEDFGKEFGNDMCNRCKFKGVCEELSRIAKEEKTNFDGSIAHESM